MSDEVDFKYPQRTIRIANIYVQQRYRINSSQVVHEVHNRSRWNNTHSLLPRPFDISPQPLAGMNSLFHAAKAGKMAWNGTPFMLQTFRHGFPHQPTALAFDPVQRLLAIGTKSGSLRMYPSTLSLIRWHPAIKRLSFRGEGEKCAINSSLLHPTRYNFHFLSLFPNFLSARHVRLLLCSSLSSDRQIFSRSRIVSKCTRVILFLIAKQRLSRTTVLAEVKNPVPFLWPL